MKLAVYLGDLPESEENKTKNVYDFSSLNYEPLSEKKLAEYIMNINTRPLLKAKALRNQENQSGRFWGLSRRNWAKVQNGSRLLF